MPKITKDEELKKLTEKTESALSQTTERTLPEQSYADKVLKLDFAKRTYEQGLIAAVNRLSIDPLKDQLEDQQVLNWKELLVKNQNERRQLEHERKIQELLIPGTSHSIKDLMDDRVTSISTEAYEELYFPSGEKSVLEHFSSDNKKIINEKLNQALNNHIKNDPSVLPLKPSPDSSEKKEFKESQTELKRQGAVKKIKLPIKPDEILLQENKSEPNIEALSNLGASSDSQKKSEAVTGRFKSRLVDSQLFFQTPLESSKNSEEKKEQLTNKRHARLFES